MASSAEAMDLQMMTAIRTLLALDLTREAALQRVLVEGAEARLIRSALMIAPRADWRLPLRNAASIRRLEWMSACPPPRQRPHLSRLPRSSESASRVIVSATPETANAVMALARAADVPAVEIGVVGGDRIRLLIDGRRVIDETVADAEWIWATAIESRSTQPSYRVTRTVRGLTAPSQAQAVRRRLLSAAEVTALHLIRFHVPVARRP